VRSRTTRQFWKQFERLPANIQNQARETYKLWLEYPDYPSLEYKQVHNTEPIYSVRIGIHYRAVGVKHDDYMLWFWIGTHAAYDKLLKRQ
jgi:hypothetical protein